MRPAQATMKHRGSVILLVIGLLTIVAMLGTTLLLVARLDQKTSRAVASAAPAMAAAQGVLDQLRADRAVDLHFRPPNGTIVYEVLTAPEDAIDYPDEAADKALANIEPIDPNATTKHWLHITHLSTVPDSSYVQAGVPVFHDVAQDDPNMADADGDGVGDSLLFDTGVQDPQGGHFHAAVRMIDTSGLMNLNTAYDGQLITANPSMTQVDVSLRQFLTDATMSGKFTPVIDGRQAAIPIGQYYLNYVRCPLNVPAGFNVTPYDLADLMGLACDPNKAGSGRLFTNLGTYDTSILHLLTTWSASRISSPQYGSVGGASPPQNKVDVNWAMTSGDPNNLYNPIHYVLQLGADDPNNAVKAAQMAVNIIDYLDADDIVTRRQVPGRSDFVYGTERQPFISKIFYKRNIPNDQFTIYTVLGIELYNPYSTTINLAEYQLKDKNGNNIGGLWGTLTNNATIAPNDRFIIRLADDPGKLGTEIKIRPELFGDNRYVAVFVPNLDIASPIRIFRMGNGQGICIDIAPALPFVEPAFPGDFHWTARFRDDRRDAARYTLGGAIHETNDQLDPNLYDYTQIQMGNPNPIGLPYPPGPPFVPVYVRNDPAYNAAANFVNIGELTKLYYVGPSPAQPLSLALQTLDRGIDPLSGVVANNGPRVPLASLLSEFLMVRSPEHSVSGVTTYGMVNINTAPVGVLKCLPGLAQIAGNDRNRVAAEIAAYRDHTSNPGGTNYAQTREAATVITNLRNAAGFATAGEINIPIQKALVPVGTYGTDAPDNYSVTPDNSDDGLGNVSDLASCPVGDPDKHNVYYKWLSNQITVRSDTYLAYILVRSPGGSADRDRRFVALIDRSRCNAAGVLPAVLMMAEIK